MRIQEGRYIMQEVGEITGQYVSGGGSRAAGVKIPVSPAVLFCKKELTLSMGKKGDV